MENEFLSQIIKKLLENKDYPKYQMERRIDIFINFFLPYIIQTVLNGEFTVDFIIPEFPVKQKNNQSKNLDYFAVCQAQKAVFLVELKTDVNSCKPEQLDQYFKIHGKTIPEIIKDIKKIREAAKSQYRKKYDGLLDKLKNEVPEDGRFEILYILPEKGIERLKMYKSDPEQNLQFVQLGHLNTLEISGSFRDEWDMIRKSEIFKNENLVIIKIMTGS